MEQQIVKQARMKIDHLLNQAKAITPNREVALALTNLQRGGMWLGLVLAALGASNPYPESTDPTSAKIEERADQAKDSPDMFEGMPTENRTQSVKWLRLNIQNLVDHLKMKVNYNSELLVALQALQESKMWFGQELNNIRIQEESKATG